MRYFLCGQTGNINRGCEAIISSTVKVLGQRNGDVYFATFAPEMDRALARRLGITMISYGGYPSSIHRYVCVGLRKLHKKSLAGFSMIEKPLFDMLKSDDVCLNIGGDVYCYGRPTISLALNNFTQKKGITNILWCCSIEKDNIKGEIFDDLNKYKYIFAREQITYDNLVSAGIPKEKVIKCCDPAFFLDRQEVELPKGFAIGNTVGINVSEMVIKDGDSTVYDNVISMIKHIIETTDMNICLIPHVYSIKENRNDYPILKKIYEEFSNDRVSMVDKEYNCEQLKYIISNCRFFFGARTHSTIAAYSSCVPTVVLGYSVKSKGIATDLFGTYEKYVLPYNEIKGKDDLINSFNWLVENENEIKKRIAQFLPEYQKSLSDNVNKYILNNKKVEKCFSICDENQCTGCMACRDICPQQCISVTKDEKGFDRPKINFDLCVNCGLCRKRCPVANKCKDDNTKPIAFAAINKNEEIRLRSSSGGIFNLISEKIIEDDGAVVGAAFDDEFNVYQKVCTTKEQLNEIMGSKYVQSSTKNAYRQTKEMLESGKKVLFTGTPCQIGGLYAYLNKDYANLYTQDIICHGVPSPKVWNKYTEYRKETANFDIKNIAFRNKETGWKKYSVKFDFEDGTSYSQSLVNDLYMRGYLFHLFLRPSCSQCSFKQMHRESDLTLADFWGVEKILPEMNDDRGTSLVIIHSEKGKELFNSISSDLLSKEVDFDSAIKENASYFKSTNMSALSNSFYKDASGMPFDKLIEKYCGTSLASKIRRKLVNLLNF